MITISFWHLQREGASQLILSWKKGIYQLNRLLLYILEWRKRYLKFSFFVIRVLRRLNFFLNRLYLFLHLLLESLSDSQKAPLWVLWCRRVIQHLSSENTTAILLFVASLNVSGAFAKLSCVPLLLWLLIGRSGPSLILLWMEVWMCAEWIIQLVYRVPMVTVGLRAARSRAICQHLVALVFDEAHFFSSEDRLNNAANFRDLGRASHQYHGVDCCRIDVYQVHLITSQLMLCLFHRLVKLINAALENILCDLFKILTSDSCFKTEALLYVKCWPERVKLSWT